MQKHIYQDYINNLQRAFERRLDDISVEFNFDLGPEFEIAICEILSSFLPRKYGVCRGFVVNAEGETAGDDIIIYDQERFPTFRPITNRAFDIKNKIPVEAVYAYVEAKHTLNADSLKKAVRQVQTVKELCSRRESVSLYQIDPYIESNVQPPYPLLQWPKYRNPVFGMILSRYSSGADGVKPASSSADVHAFLQAQVNGMDKSPYLPDLIVAGADNYLSPSHSKADGQNQPTLHWIPDVSIGYQVLEKPAESFGAALAQLAGAIDWARLGRMPWGRITNDVRHPESQV